MPNKIIKLTEPDMNGNSNIELSFDESGFYILVNGNKLYIRQVNNTSLEEEFKKAMEPPKPEPPKVPKANVRELKTVSLRYTKPQEFVPTKLVWYEIDVNEFSVKQMRFIERDVLGIMEFVNSPEKSMIVIESIFTEKEYRNQGYGSKTLKGFLESEAIKDKVIILQSKLLLEEYKEEPTEKDYTESFINQARFFERHGFRNINALCGFENSIAYIYRNEASEAIINKIIELELNNGDFIN